MIPRERLTRQNREGGGGGEEKYACTQPLFVWRTPVHWIHGGNCLVQFRMFRLPAANQGHMAGHIGTHIFQAFLLYPDSSRFWKIWFSRGRTLSVPRVTHIAYRWEQKEAVIAILSRRDLLASSSSFWFEWRKSWRVNLHVWSLFDLSKVTCTNRSVVQSLSDLTMIATDEECVNSSETACFMTWKKNTSSQQSQWKNDGHEGTQIAFTVSTSPRRDVFFADS